MWEGKALVFLDAPLQLLGFGFGLFSLFSSKPSAPDYTPYLDQVRFPWCSACLAQGNALITWYPTCLPLLMLSHLVTLLFRLQINRTTLETLDRVKSLQDQLTLVQAELINIRNDIKDLKCSVETARLDTDTRAIQVR